MDVPLTMRGDQATVAQTMQFCCSASTGGTIFWFGMITMEADSQGGDKFVALVFWFG